MSSNTISYTALLKSLTSHQQVLEEKYSLMPSPESWYWEATSILRDLIVAIDKNKSLSSKNDDDFWNRIFTSLGLLLELESIFQVLSVMEGKNLEIYLSKLKLVFKGPLLMNNEDSNNNLGRNTLFELKVFSKLINNGYDAKIHYDHPDISFQVEVREYVVECKRLYKPETLISNAHAALSQLLKFSLSEPKPEGIYARYGIVAVSLSRYIHKGEKLFDANSEEGARERINFEMKKIFDKNKDELLRPFPVNIPALILEYSDRGSIDKPYTYNFIDVHETADGRYSRFNLVAEDLKKLDD